MLNNTTLYSLENLLKNERFCRSLYQNTPLLYFVFDDDNVILSVNRRGAEYLQDSPDDLIGRSIFDVFHSEDRSQIERQIERVRQNPVETAELELRRVGQGGKDVFVSGEVRRVELGADENLFLLIGADVTDYKRAQDELSECRIRYQSVVENAPVIFFALDRNGVFTMSEGAGLKKLNTAPGEAVGKSVFELHAGRPQILENIRRALAGESFTTGVELDDLMFEVSYSAVRDSTGAVAGVMGVSVDVSERKRAEEAQRDSENRYRTFIEQSSEGIWRIEMRAPIPISLPPEEQIERIYAGCFLAECNDALARMYGFERAADLTGSQLDFMMRSDAGNRAALRAFIEAGYRTVEAETRQLDVAGREKYFLNNVVGIVEGGEFVRMWGTHRDITEKKHAEQRMEEAIRQSQIFAEREAVINRITSHVRQSLKVEEVFNAIVGELGEHLKVDRCILYLFDHGCDLARAAAGYFSDAAGGSADEFHVPLPLTLTTVEALFKAEFIAFDDVANASIIRPLYENVLRPRAVKSLMCVSIRVGHEITGVLSFTCKEIRHWSQSDLELARAIANQAGIAIRQAELYQRAEAVSLREQLVNRLGMQIRASLQLSEVLHAATHELGDALGASRVYLRFYDYNNPTKNVPAEHEFVAAAHAATPPPPVLATYVNAIGQKLLRERKTIVIDDAANLNRQQDAELADYMRDTIGKRGVKSAAYCPLVVQNSFRGTLCIEQTDRLRRWTEDEIKLIEGVAVQLSLGIAQAELFEITRRAKREWETTFDAMSDGVLIFNRERRLIRVNHAGAAFEQSEPPALLGKSCCEIFIPENESDGCIIQEVIKTKRRITIEVISKISARPLLITAEPLVDDQGATVGAVSTVRDLHELRQAETIAREQGILLAQILEGVLEPIFAVEESGNLLWSNKATTDIYGCSSEELQQRHFLDMVHPDERGAAKNVLQQAFKGTAQFYESRFLTGAGETRHAVFNSVPLQASGNAQSAKVLWFARDVTDQKRAVEHALQADKLRALGQLASGVAHDFNNALTAILGRVQLLNRQTSDEIVRASLRVVQTAAEDAAATVRRVQAFARQSPADDFRAVEIAALLRDSVEMMRTRWETEARSRGIDYKIETTADCALFTRGNASELREVFVNLIGNALDAMPTGGKLKIACDCADENVLIRFADTGTGISEEIQKRIFEPFFTTKGAAGGTGLGLSVSYGIVEAHNGRICVSSTPGEGTTFIVHLPVAEQTENCPVAPAQTAAAKDKLSILVVDDEDFVREALAEMLRALEHTVTEADSGGAALQKMQESEFDVLFTDLTMPGMDGWQLARAFRQKKEAAKIVMVTGYGKNVQPESSDDKRLINAIIGKPFDFRQLDETLDQLRSEKV